MVSKLDVKLQLNVSEERYGAVLGCTVNAVTIAIFSSVS